MENDEKRKLALKDEMRSYTEKYKNGYLSEREYLARVDEIHKQIDEINRKQQQRNEEITNSKITVKMKNGFQNKASSFVEVLGLIVAIVIIALLIKGCFWLFTNNNDGPDYETHYIDENGNGKLDQGEDNYTQDEDGNIVDIDDDHSNFE